jgi:hypothetical protein
VKRVVTGQDEVFGPWLAKLLGNEWVPGKGSIIGLWEDGIGPVAGCLYESCNGASVVGSLAGIGRKWMNREYLWYCYYYPFEELKVNKIIGIVESSNLEARRLDEHMGFTLEATLVGCAPKGDLLIYTMTKSQCRWLNLKHSYRGLINEQAQSSAST